MNKEDLTKLPSEELVRYLIDESRNWSYHECSANWHDSGVNHNLREAGKAEDKVTEIMEELLRRLSK